MNDFKQFKETKIPKGKQVIFELLSIANDPINKGLKIIPLTLIPPKDVIIFEGEMYEIGSVLSFGIDGTPNYEFDLMFLPQSGGKMVLESGNIRHEVIYKFFKWSNFNASNIHRDPSKQAIFRELNPEKEDAERLESKETTIKVKSMIQNLNPEEVKELGTALNVVGKEGLYDLADTKASAILSVIETLGGKDVLKMVNKAVQRKKLITDYVAKTVSFNKKVIFLYEGEDWDRQALITELEATDPDLLDAILASVG
jgi:hypothetical protein